MRTERHVCDSAADARAMRAGYLLHGEDPQTEIYIDRREPWVLVIEHHDQDGETLTIRWGELGMDAVRPTDPSVN